MPLVFLLVHPRSTFLSMPNMSDCNGLIGRTDTRPHPRILIGASDDKQAPPSRAVLRDRHPNSKPPAIPADLNDPLAAGGGSPQQRNLMPGESPAIIPFAAFRRTRIIVNNAAARAAGLTSPPNIVSKGNKVIDE